MKGLLAVAIAIVGLSTITFAGPKVEIPVRHWDFGKVPQNSTVSHEYWIKNVGDETLRIINVKPG